MQFWNVVLVIIFGMLFLLGLISGSITGWMLISEPLVALVVGAVVGLFVSGSSGMSSTLLTAPVIHQLANITLAIALMTTALQVPHEYIRHRWRTILVLLGVGMPIMWLVSGAALYFALGVPVWVALLIAGAITPTDPVLASTIVTGNLAEENIPARMRRLIIVESGLNDGLAYAFVLLPLTILSQPAGQALPDWFLHDVLWEVGGALVFGALIGIVAGLLANFAIAAHAMAHASFLGLTLALALLSLGLLDLIGTDAILGVFAAGLGFSEMLNYRGHQLERTEHVQEAVERFFNLPVFFVLGVALPWSAWRHMGWSALVVVLAILLARRIPAILALSPFLHPSICNRTEALFTGWFGPVGISALYYATLNLPSSAGGVSLADVSPVITLVILGSVVAHGASATTLTKRFGQRKIEGGSEGAQPQTEEEQQDAIIEAISRSVRTDIERSTDDIIERVIIRHLTAPAQDVAGIQGQADMNYLRLDGIRERAGAQIGSRREASEEIAREIAQELSHRLGDDAARSVSDELAHALNRDEDTDEENEETDEESDDSASPAAGNVDGGRDWQRGS